MNAVSAVEPSVEISGNTPGAMLRREREQRGLTVQNVSDELHLDHWLVEALEENRFLALGPPVYAKGHLRKYAVLLGLSPDLILARYQAIAQPPPPLPPPAEALLAPPPGVRRLDWQSLDWRMYALVAALVFTAAGSTWLFTRPSQTAAEAPSQMAASSQPVTTFQPPGPATLAEGAAPVAPVTGTSESSPTTAASTPVRPPAATVATTLPPAARPGAVPPPRTATPPPATQPAPSSTVAAIAKNPASPVAANTATTQQSPAAAGAPTEPAAVPEEVQVSLRLEFSSASWAEVYDGDGRRLLYAVGDPNRARTISGKPPLKVTLGTAGSVQARVNGRPIAIPRRIGQDSSSFTVNANGSVRQPSR